MKKQIPFMRIAITAFLAATLLDATAAKKNEPDDPEDILEALGGKHFIEKMKVDDVGSVKVKDRKTDEETYFHVYSSYNRDTEKYRVIIFDNTPRYLGYYESEFEPSDYEEGAVLLDSGDGESFYKIRLTTSGPSSKINIDGAPSLFVKNEKGEADAKQAAAAAEAEAAAAEPVQPEYREWILISRGKKVPVQAIFVKQTGSKIYLKRQADGRTKDFPTSMLSKEDQEYLKLLK